MALHVIQKPSKRSRYQPHLPPEIIMIIFDFLADSPEDLQHPLYHCMFVCKLFHDIAKPKLYEALLLKRTDYLYRGLPIERSKIPYTKRDILRISMISELIMARYFSIVKKNTMVDFVPNRSFAVTAISDSSYNIIDPEKHQLLEKLQALWISSANARAGLRSENTVKIIEVNERKLSLRDIDAHLNPKHQIYAKPNTILKDYHEPWTMRSKFFQNKSIELTHKKQLFLRSGRGNRWPLVFFLLLRLECGRQELIRCQIMDRHKICITDLSSYKVCRQCDNETRVLICSRCRCTWYCSEECQKKDYKQHRISCWTMGCLNERVNGKVFTN